MISAYDLLALAAAFCWSLGAVLAVSPVRHLGSFAFNRWRLLFVALMLWPPAILSGSLHGLGAGDALVIAASGLMGAFLGDIAMFAAIDRIGPRRTGVLFATHALFAALLGYLFLGERIGLQAGVGVLLTVAGVGCAILLGRREGESHAWESDRGSLRIGLMLGLAAALCQAISALIARPVMAGGLDPVLASALRVSVSCAAHFACLWAGLPMARAVASPTPRVLVQTALNGAVAMGTGMTLLLLALRYGEVGIVSVLSSVTPVMLLPLLWWQLGRAPAPGAWLGALLTVMGTALVLLR